MIKPEQVPYNVTREALTAWMGSEGTIMSAMENAIAAALNAWPGMGRDWSNDEEIIALPLPPQEASDE